MENNLPLNLISLRTFPIFKFQLKLTFHLVIYTLYSSLDYCVHYKCCYRLSALTLHLETRVASVKNCCKVAAVIAEGSVLLDSVKEG